MKKLICLIIGTLLLSGCQPVLKGIEEVVDSKIKTSPKTEITEEKPEITEEKPTILEEKKEITDRLANEDFYRANHYFSSTYQEGVTTHEELLNLAYWLYVGEGGEVNHELLNETYYDVIPYDNFNEQISLYFDHELEKKGSATWGFQEDNYYQPALECGFLSSNFTQGERLVIESYETNYFAPEYSDVVSDVE